MCTFAVYYNAGEGLEVVPGTSITGPCTEILSNQKALIKDILNTATIDTMTPSVLGTTVAEFTGTDAVNFFSANL